VAVDSVQAMLRANGYHGLRRSFTACFWACWFLTLSEISLFITCFIAPFEFKEILISVTAVLACLLMVLYMSLAYYGVKLSNHMGKTSAVHMQHHRILDYRSVYYGKNYVDPKSVTNRNSTQIRSATLETAPLIVQILRSHELHRSFRLTWLLSFLGFRWAEIPTPLHENMYRVCLETVSNLKNPRITAPALSRQHGLIQSRLTVAATAMSHINSDRGDMIGNDPVSAAPIFLFAMLLSERYVSPALQDFHYRCDGEDKAVDV
jgi:hypothetical protein